MSGNGYGTSNFAGERFFKRLKAEMSGGRTGQSAGKRKLGCSNTSIAFTTRAIATPIWAGDAAVIDAHNSPCIGVAENI